MKQIIVNLPDQLYARLEAEAAATGRTMSEILIAALATHLDRVWPDRTDTLTREHAHQLVDQLDADDVGTAVTFLRQLAEGIPQQTFAPGPVKPPDEPAQR
jgi:plasmid stability protein